MSSHDRTGLLLTLTLMLVGGGCGGDPVLDPLAASLKAYDRGQEALERSGYTEAAEAFAEAAGLDPSSPELLAWQGAALEGAGEDVRARTVYDSGLERFPRSVDLRYSRAALAARTGDIETAGTDLRFMYARDLLDPMEAGEDEDFAPLIEHPDTTMLVPRPQVWLEARAEEGAVLVGASWSLGFTIEAPRGPELQVSNMGEGSPLLRLERVVEDIEDVSLRTTRRTLETAWTAMGEGRGRMGPWLVAAGGTSALSARFPVEVIALQGRADPDSGQGKRTVALVLPSVFLADHEPPFAGRVGKRRVAMGAPGDQLLRVDDAGAAHTDGLELVLRRGGQPAWKARVWGPQVTGRVEVRSKGELLAADPPP